MLKNILKLAGVKELSKNEQKNVKGGACNPEEDCCGACSCGTVTYYRYLWQSCGGGCTPIGGCI